MDKKQVQISVGELVAEIAPMQLPEAMLEQLMVAAGGIAVKSLNPSIADSFEIDIHNACAQMVSEQDMPFFMQLMVKAVIVIKPLLAKTEEVDLNGQWEVTGNLEGEFLKLNFVPGQYVEPSRENMSNTIVSYSSLSLLEKAEQVIAILGGDIDRERLGKLLVSSQSHFTNNARSNPLAVARDILGNFYASLKSLTAESPVQLTFDDAQTINSFVYDFIGLLSVEVQKISHDITEEAQAIVAAGGSVQITLVATAGETLAEDGFAITIDKVFYEGANEEAETETADLGEATAEAEDNVADAPAADDTAEAVADPAV